MKLIRCLMILFSLITLNYSNYAWTMSIQKNDHIYNYSYSGTESLYISNVSQESDDPDEIIIHGDYLKAALIATEEFNKYIANKWMGNISPIASHMSNIVNYSITIRKEVKEEKYEISFSPLPFQDGPIIGGGTTYFIDTKSFKILKKEHSM